MIKKLTLFVIITFFLINYVYASSSEIISSESVNYNISIIKVVDSKTLLLNINNIENITINRVQSGAPFIGEKKSSMFPEIRFVLTKLLYSQNYGSQNFANLYVFIEKNLSTKNNRTDLYFNGKNYTIEFNKTIDEDHAIISINRDMRVITPTYVNEFYLKEFGFNNPKIRYVITRINDAPNSSGTEEMTALFGFEILLEQERCYENWSCSNWSNCTNGLQLRECSDLNHCSTNFNKPSNNQSCYSIYDCINECNFTSEKSCLNLTTIVNCGNYDKDICLEWGNMITCPNDNLCDNKTFECIPESNNINSISKLDNNKECEKIGSQNNEKYCSINYTLENKKAEESICNYDYECKFECINGKCRSNLAIVDKSNNSNYVILILVAVIIFLLIIIIFIILKRNQKPRELNDIKRVIESDKSLEKTINNKTNDNNSKNLNDIKNNEKVNEVENNKIDNSTKVNNPNFDNKVKKISDDSKNIEKNELNKISESKEINEENKTSSDNKNINEVKNEENKPIENIISPNDKKEDKKEDIKQQVENANVNNDNSDKPNEAKSS